MSGMTDARALDFIRVYLAPYSAHGEKDQVVEHIASRLRGEAQGGQEPVAWYTEDHLTDKSATTYSAEVAERWRNKSWPVHPLYTRPPAALSSTAAPADGVIEAAFDDGFTVAKNIAASFLTDEANREMAWTVGRSQPPYCDKPGNRQWNGSTAQAAIATARAALGMH